MDGLACVRADGHGRSLGARPRRRRWRWRRFLPRHERRCRGFPGNERRGQPRAVPGDVWEPEPAERSVRTEPKPIRSSAAAPAVPAWQGGNQRRSASPRTRGRPASVHGEHLSRGLHGYQGAVQLPSGRRHRHADDGRQRLRSGLERRDRPGRHVHHRGDPPSRSRALRSQRVRPARRAFRLPLGRPAIGHVQRDGQQRRGGHHPVPFGRPCGECGQRVDAAGSQERAESLPERSSRNAQEEAQLQEERHAVGEGG